MSRYLVLILLLSAAPATAQTVHLPDHVAIDEPVELRVSGLKPGAILTLEVERRGPGAAASETNYVVPADGVVDPALIAPTHGYKGVDPAGPFWSMRPLREGAEKPMTLTVRAKINGVVVASATAPLAETTATTNFEDIPAFPAARLYRPTRSGRFPVIIALGGSSGGASFGRSIGPRLAAQGYAVLALPNYNADWGEPAIPGLPNDFVDIPVDRLEAVHRWILGRTDLDPRAIGLYGVSKGAEFAMIAASRFPWLAAVVGIVPSDVVWEGWGTPDPEGTRSSFSWRGRSLSFVPYQGMTETIAALGRGERRTRIVPHLDGRRAHPERAAAARIPVERYSGPMLIAGGDLDSTWPSGEMVRAIAERRAAAGRSTVVFSFADAGHGLSGTGWSPLNYQGVENEAPALARTQAKLWQATLKFLDDHLSNRQR